MKWKSHPSTSMTRFCVETVLQENLLLTSRFRIGHHSRRQCPMARNFSVDRTIPIIWPFVDIFKTAYYWCKCIVFCLPNFANYWLTHAHTHNNPFVVIKHISFATWCLLSRCYHFLLHFLLIIISIVSIGRVEIILFSTLPLSLTLLLQ